MTRDNIIILLHLFHLPAYTPAPASAAATGGSNVNREFTFRTVTVVVVGAAAKKALDVEQRRAGLTKEVHGDHTNDA